MTNNAVDQNPQQKSPTNFLSQFIGPFDPDKQVKAMVASCYIRDGDDFLELYYMGWKSIRNNRSYRSKLFINLRMAIECSLKGLIVSFSDDTESPEAAYLTARKRSHSLAALLKETQTRSKGTKNYLRKTSTKLIHKLDAMKVGIRYEVDMVAEFSKESFKDGFYESGPMTGTIGSDRWMMSLHEHTLYINKKAHNAFRHNLGDHNGYKLSDAEARTKRINGFMKSVNLKEKPSSDNPEQEPLSLGDKHQTTATQSCSSPHMNTTRLHANQSH